MGERGIVAQEDILNIRQLLQLKKEIDWLYLIQLALRHGLVPLLYRNL